MFQKQTYINRRNELKKKVGNGIILLLANEQTGMSFKDNWYHFRQDSTFLYFIGLDIPSLIAVIDLDDNTETLFGDDLSVDDIVWTGPQPALIELAEKTGINTVRPLKELETVIKTAQAKKQTIHYLPPYRAEHTEKLACLLSASTSLINNEASISLIKSVVALRSIKSAEEITEIKKAVAITEQMQLIAMRTAKAGMTEAQVAGGVHGVSIGAGGELSFPTILTTNGQILHNHFTNAVIPEGKMILLDCGAETEMHYAGDLTRTFPVDAKFTTLQKEVYKIVLNAKQAAVAALKPGKLFKDIHLLACEKLVEGLQQVGLMKGDIKEAVNAGAHTLFFQCGLGHMMGLDVHDMENFGEQYVGYTEELQKSTEFGLKSLRLGKALDAGYVVTVEPGLYFIPELMDMWAAEKKHSNFINYNKLDAFRNFSGIRIEDDYLITATGSELLSTSLPETAEEIEEIPLQ